MLIPSIVCDGRATYITPKGFRIGSRGLVMKAGDFYAGIVSKSDRRKVRKYARSNGFIGHATTPTNAS